MKVKLLFRNFDVPSWELVIKQTDINDKFLLKQLRVKGIKKRNIEFMLSDDKSEYGVFSCNIAPDPIGNITIKDIK